MPADLRRKREKGGKGGGREGRGRRDLFFLPIHSPCLRSQDAGTAGLEGSGRREHRNGIPTWHSDCFLASKNPRKTITPEKIFSALADFSSDPCLAWPSCENVYIRPFVTRQL